MIQEHYIMIQFHLHMLNGDVYHSKHHTLAETEYHPFFHLREGMEVDWERNGERGIATVSWGNMYNHPSEKNTTVHEINLIAKFI